MKICPSLSVGEKYFVRTVTFYYVGELVGHYPELGVGGAIGLRHCSWVAESERWSVTMETGALREVEPYQSGDEVIVMLGAVVDLVPWRHALPTEPK